MRFTSELDRAVSELKAGGCDRLIVDLRGNIGGSLGFARLASYLCPDRRPIGHSLTPRRLRTGYTIVELPQVAMPQNRFELALALTRFAVKDKSLMLLTQGLGLQPFHGRTVLLVNEWTNSAAEIVAAFAREHGLGADSWAEDARERARRRKLLGRRGLLASSTGVRLVHIKG